MKLVQILKNERGIALITSLMLTMLSLVVVLTALYLITLSTKQSAAVKTYKTALQASYGGSDLVLKDMLPQIMMKADLLVDAGKVTAAFQGIRSSFSGLSDLSLGSSYGSDTAAGRCLQAKLTTRPEGDPDAVPRIPPWSEVCQDPGNKLSATSLRPKDLPDMAFSVPSADGASFKVYSKIVDTVPGNSDISGVNLMGAGVAETQNNISPKHIPYVYRVEVQAERANNPNENANLSLLYAY